MRHIKIENKDYMLDIESYWEDHMINPHLGLLKWYVDMKPIGTIIDIGANVGLMSIMFHDSIKYNKFICVEPNKVTMNRLKTNISFINAEFLECAIGNYIGTCSMMSNYGTSGTYEISDAGDSVDLITLDSLNLTNVSLIKIDVEGADIEVLQGAINTINKNRPIIHFEHHADLCDKSILYKFINSINYCIINLEKNGIFVPDKINTYILVPSELMAHKLFVLGYNGCDYFESWYDREQFKNTKLYYFDNGQQKLSDTLNKDLVYATTRNIGCAGGWNLMCDYAFKTLNLDKIIIGQEDAMISEEILKELYNNCNPTTICGTYDNSFDFAVFALHRDTFNLVGRMDENLLFSGCEDDDYKYRCRLNNIAIKSLGISNKWNISIANNNNIVPKKYSTYSANYIKTKWGDYKYKFPFNNLNYIHAPTEMFINHYGNLKEWPSELEFRQIKNK